MYKPTFEIYLDELGKYRFRVRASNNKIITIGDGCNTRDSCINGIIDVKDSTEEYHDSKIKDFTSGETSLFLNRSKHSIKLGSTITFSGRLFGNVTGEGLDNAKIRIYENDGTLLKETPLASGKTSILGGFNIDWIVKKMDWWDDSIEVLARFDGEDNLKGSYSKKLSFHVIKWDMLPNILRIYDNNLNLEKRL